MAQQEHEEYQYINLIKKIIEQGTWEEGRNGRTKSIFGETMRFSLQNGKIPILTTKKTAWKTCLKELLWFIRGETYNKLLQNYNNTNYPFNLIENIKDNVIKTRNEIELEYSKNLNIYKMTNDHSNNTEQKKIGN